MLAPDICTVGSGEGISDLPHTHIPQDSKVSVRSCTGRISIAAPACVRSRSAGEIDTQQLGAGLVPIRHPLEHAA